VLGNPENHGRVVHIAGTNGKGSVAYKTEYGLRLQGYKTGMFVSPAIGNHNTSLTLNGNYVN
jgi:dihydrofolate synthase/folylpolyglutamate synthase